MSVTVLYVDSDERCLKRLEKLSGRTGFDLFTSKTVEEGKRIADERDIEVVVSELDFRDGDAAELFSELIKNCPNTRKILFSERDLETVTDSEAFKLSDMFLPKQESHSFKRLVRNVEELLERTKF